MRPARTRAHAHTRRYAAALVLALALVATAGIAGAASESASTVVSVTVPSATNIDVATGCAADSPDITDFGQLIPGSNTVTGTDCTVEFGSSNDTSMLRAYQADGLGNALWRVADGSPYAGFAGGSVTRAGMARGVGLNVTSDGRPVAFNTGDDVFRWTTAGIPDVSLNGSGEVLDPSSGAESGIVDSSDRLVVLSDDGADLQVYRYLADGTPDATFGTAGESIFDVFATDHPRVIREHPDGGYLVLSESDNGGDWDMYVTRITSSGAIDASYATSGSHQIDASLSGGTFATADTLADGSIVVATRSDGPDAIRVTKLTPAGALDAGFAGGGETLVPFVLASGEVPRGIDVHHDGSIAIVGNMSSARSIILKLDANGVKDAGFGTGGEIYNLAMSNDEARSVLFEPDGDLLVGGRFNSGGGLDYEAYLARFDEAGNFDVSFGGTGMVTFPGVAGNDMIDRDELITLGADGTIYVAASTNAEADLTIFAFGGLPVPDYANGADDWDTAAPNDMMFGACLFSLAGTGSPAAAAPWAATGSCNATDADPWQQISVDAGGGNAKVAEETSSGSTDASINLRFGIRVADDQPPGSYAAPITFEAVAPNV